LVPTPPPFLKDTLTPPVTADAQPDAGHHPTVEMPDYQAAVDEIRRPDACARPCSPPTSLEPLGDGLDLQPDAAAQDRLCHSSTPPTSPTPTAAIPSTSTNPKS
jgi:hypothetical protein